MVCDDLAIVFRDHGSNVPVLGKKTTQRTATRTTIEPNGNFFGGIHIGRREEPEEEFTSLVGGTGDGKESSIRLANIKVNIRKGRTIDDKLCSCG